MAIYLLASEEDRDDIGKIVIGKFPNDSRKIGCGQWLISADMTAESILNHLGMAKGEKGRVLLTAVKSYFGWHNKDVWDWIDLKAS